MREHNSSRRIGRFGEQLAQHYLTKHSYSIIDSNVKVSHCELDIIAYKKPLYVFVEVKTLAKNMQTPAEWALSEKQINTLKRAIYMYCSSREITSSKTRLDCITINLIRAQNIAKLKHYRDILH